ncbi:MAG: M14 family metallopeptidase [Gemmatimonadota bacterium]
MSGRTLRVRAIARAAALSATLQIAGALTVAAQAPPRDLRNAFTAGYILQDRNQDDVIDFVRARIVLPARPSAAELAAAANIAARLGYETSALDLGLAVANAQPAASYDLPVIVVGSPAWLAAATSSRSTLGPGQGALAFLAPGSVLRAGGLQLDANDASGLLAIAGYVSARYPSIWGLRAQSHADVVDRVQRYLVQEGAAGADVLLDRIVVEDGRAGVSRVELRIPAQHDSVYRRMASALARADSALRDTAFARTISRDTTARRNRVRPQDLQFTDLHRIDIAFEPAAPSTAGRTIHLLPTRPWGTRPGAEYTNRESPDFTLSDLYTIRGLFRDTNQDLVPDRTDALLSLHNGDAASGMVDLAARIGLETAGMRLPFVDVDRQRDYLPDEGFPIVVGDGHYQFGRLFREGKLHTGAEGEGFLEFVKGGFNKRNGLVIGGDVQAISDYMSRRMPYLWEYGKGNFELRDVEADVRRFFQAKDAPGQVALAINKTRTWLDRLKGKIIDSVSLELAARERPERLDAFMSGVVREKLPNAKVDVQSFATGFGVGKPIFREDFEIAWEVDEVRKVFREQAMPKLNAQSRGRIEVRVSESPEIRAQLQKEITAALTAKGIPAGAFDVSVLSAYKQGYSWLNDRVLPRLKGQPVGRIEIRYLTLKDSKEVRWQEIESDTRWLQELYPVDAVMAKELGIPDSLITFTAVQSARPIYSVRALDRSGNVILEDSFDPKYVVRPFFDLFPEYESVRVTTGWLTVEAHGAMVLDQRIRTDPETFWDHFQQQTYQRMVDYAMDVQNGRPSPANAPYFDELRVDLTLSEPNYRIGIDEEVISSLEALHEDIYFETLTLFTLLGQRYGVGDLAYLGRVLPYIQPGGDGKPGRARISMTGKDRGVPELVLTYRERGQPPVKQRYPLSALPVDPPRLRGIAVLAQRTQVERLLFEVVAIDSVDRFEEYKARSSESAIDRTFLATSLLSNLAANLRELQGAGLFENALSYDRVRSLQFRFIVRDTLAAHQSLYTLERSRNPRSTRNPTLESATRDPRSAIRDPIVQWDTPIPPIESDSIMARLATFPVVNAYYLTRSFLGQNVFAADFLPPHDARYISQAKLNALKPTLFLSGRQHANEVSSTSHILKLGELLATDTAYAKLLKKANVVLHPITNPDGARLAVEMQRTNPDFMLHAGYLGALGVDATSGAGNPDAIYPESQVRPELMETWLPDIYVNMHGYPSHEWVQYFAGYSAWVRSRSGAQRSWWLPRGWFIPGFSWVDDARYPELKKAQFAILDSIAAAITSMPEGNAMNKRLYARYQKYGKQETEDFREYFHNGMLVSLALRGQPVAGALTPNNPRVNYISITTEAPDETARGDWLKLVASQGLAHSSALLRYLANGTNEIRRESTVYDGFVIRSVFRKKPVLPKQ